MEITNLAQLIVEQSRLQPRTPAVYFPQGRDSNGRVAYTHLTFAQLNKRSDFLAWGMQARGLRPGRRALLMIRPALDFYALFFALFKLGAVPVLIDPGMGWRGFLKCVRQVQPEAFLGIPAAQLLRLFCPRSFQSVQTNITLGRRWFWGGDSIRELPGENRPYPIFTPDPDEPAAVLFTSGSTGPAKGVTYTQRIFRTQVQLVQREYNIQPGEIDLACFPLFSLFSVGLGAAVAIPDLDPTRPASVNPKRIIEAIQSLPVTYSFGSPTLWGKVAKYCAEKKLTLPGLKRVIMAGAPVPGQVHDWLLNQVLDRDAETYTPYGATESLPVANFRGREMLSQTRAASAAGRGMCVGRPIPEIQSLIIRISDNPLEEYHQIEPLPQGEIGELCVKGDCVTREYYRNPEATRGAKIRQGAEIWHRVGDVGYFDSQGRFWFCGRKNQRVQTRDRQGQPVTLFTIPCEAIFNNFPGVRRSALVGLGSKGEQIPVMIIEPEPRQIPNREEILSQTTQLPLTALIQELLFHPSFPVDVRHNAKINREALAHWAGQRLRRISR